MKKSIKILIPCVFITFAGISTAATVKCIAFDATKKCTYDRGTTADNAEFTANCNSIAVKGIGYCSTDTGSTKGASASTLNKNLGTYCWCKMISPATSQWIYLESAMTNEQCIHTCSIDCGIALENSRDITIRNALFNNLDN